MISNSPTSCGLKTPAGPVKTPLWASTAPGVAVLAFAWSQDYYGLQEIYHWICFGPRIATRNNKAHGNLRAMGSIENPLILDAILKIEYLRVQLQLLSKYGVTVIFWRCSCCESSYGKSLTCVHVLVRHGIGSLTALNSQFWFYEAAIALVNTTTLIVWPIWTHC